MQQQSLLNSYLLQTWLGLVLAVSIIGLLCLNFRTHPSSWQTISDNLDAFQVRQYLLRRALEEDHLFVPANHPHLRFVGRWTSTSTGSRQDAAFPGSYIEFTVCNTTSIFCDLKNKPRDRTQEREEHQRVAARRVLLFSESDSTRGSSRVSLLVEINGQDIFGHEEALGIVPIARGLDPRIVHHIRITYLGSTEGFQSTLQVHGLWVGLPALVTNVTIDQSMKPSSHYHEHLCLEPHRSTTTRGKQPNPTVEIVTFERSLSPFSASEDSTTTQARLHTWYHRLSKANSLDVTLLPMSETGMHSKQSIVTIQDLFFRSGPPGTLHYLHPWSFDSTNRPSVLILQPGIEEFASLLSAISSVNAISHHTLERLKIDFITSLVRLILTIRRVAYPHMASQPKSHRNDDHSHSQSFGDSYSYVSAPSTLPIFLIAPFSSVLTQIPSTEPLTLHSVISECLSATVSMLRAQGDISTAWIDTTGWVDANHDFISAGSQEKDFRTGLSVHDKIASDRVFMTPQAGQRVASWLHVHLCPYLEESTYAEPDQMRPDPPCEVHRHDRYVGSVFLPEQIQMERKLLQRKTALLKLTFGLDGVGWHDMS
ncbi:hypothetical protein PV10_05510 [Exophiala mesophila]|uniref:Uncharacterized protein n=1 Tax=Exophiala mesophila TaxID=212818 RepID=A0A0D1ZVS5_EXOME|nr:uncharacterized protein PV10_05510 [Exophiala mesophila]KIV90908.1 hypothetical protein PV10_05510 [Exophiala mesophila]